MNESERILPAEQEQIVHHVVDQVNCKYPDIRDIISNVNHEDIDTHQNFVFGAIDSAAYDIVSDRTQFVTGEVRAIIFHKIIGTLKLEPIREKDKKGNFTTYESFSQFEEVGRVDQAPDKKRREYLDRELWSRNQEHSRAMSERFDYLSEFFSATSTDKQNALAILKTCFRDIEKIMEKMQIFCVLHGFDNPLDMSSEPDAPISFSEDDRSPIADLWRIFRLSASEKYLKQFLPEGMKKAEPYLFCFPFEKQGDVEDLTNGKPDIYERIYERKLLIYYFATPKITTLTQTRLQEVKKYLLDLAFEIKACKTSINYFSPDSGRDEILEEQNDIARVRFLYNRVEVLRKGCTAAEIGHEAVSIFRTISQALHLFIDTATSRLSATIATEALKNQVMDGLKATLYTTLDHALTDLNDVEEEPIPTMRSILREACNFLYHK